MAQKHYCIIEALRFAGHHTTRGKAFVFAKDFKTVEVKTLAYRLHIVHTTAEAAAKLLEEMNEAAEAGDLKKIRELFRQKKIPAGPDDEWVYDGPPS